MSNRDTPPASSDMGPTEAAAYWRVRHDRGDMTVQEHAEFGSWRATSQAHEAAWQATGDLWDLFDNADDPHLEAMRAAARSAGGARRSWMRPMAAALALLSVPGGVFIISRSSLWSDLSGGRAGLTSRYETQRGERATASLSDGTVVSLNSDTALEVTFDKAGRHVQLRRGQALFEVAKDKHRPFVVRAGDSAVTALGTVFDVKMAKEAFRVVLVEGRVAVSAEADPRSTAVIMTSGQELLKSRGGDIRVQTTDPEAALLWRKGLVEFNDVTLADAVEQINETSARSLRLADSRIGALRLSGVYRTGSPERFVASIAQVLPVSGRNTGEGTIIEPRKKMSE